jgi:hypothetical protein
VEIIKSTLSNPRKCEYGDFELMPEEGWKISQTFVDHDSRLLIVSLHLIDRSKWIDTGYGEKIIPSKEYKIDLNTLSVLEPEQWQKYFNYDAVEIISEDKKYKLISRRVFQPERNSDSYKEELYDLNSGKLISSGGSIAFSKNKRENLLESFCRSIREKEEQQRILEAKPDLQQFYLKQIDLLRDGDVILYYYNAENVWELSYSDKKFMLGKSDKLPTDLAEWKTMTFDFIKSYADVDDFWNEFARNPKWYTRFNYLNRSGRISSKALLLAKHIISFFNDLRRNHNFTYVEYSNINNWSNLVWSEEYQRTELKQWCSNCLKEVYYNVRYPKYICSECFDRDKSDQNGNLLEFSNLSVSGGFKITYMDKNGKTIREDDTQDYCECIIDDKLFFAQEAKFGGIVIQKKE